MSTARGAPNPNQLEQYIASGCFYAHHLPEQALLQACQPRLPRLGGGQWASASRPRPSIFQLYLEPLQKFRLAAQGHGPVQPPEQHRERIATYFDPLPFWYPPFEESADRTRSFPLHAITQRPMAMYHSWGSQNAWLRQIHGAEPAVHEPRARAAELGIADDDWVWITRDIGRVKAQVKLMDGVNPDTVWTWNAIGKRVGRLGPGARCAGGDARVPAQPPDRRAAAGQRAAAIASPTPIRSPDRLRGTTCGCGSRRQPNTRSTRRGRASSRIRRGAVRHSVGASPGRSHDRACRRQRPRSSAW